MNVRVNLLAIFVLSICSNYALAQFDTVINLPENLGSPNPSGFSGNSTGNDNGISSNTLLNVSDGGLIGLRFDAGAEDVPNTNVEVNISGGTVISGFNANSGSTVNISGGEVGSNFDAFAGSTVNISGGTFGERFGANSGSTVNISGGEFDRFFHAESSSEVNISGGTVGSNFDAGSGSTVDISGGTFGSSFNARSGSTVNISGGEFLLMAVQLMILPRLLPLVMEMFLLERYKTARRLFFQLSVLTV